MTTENTHPEPHDLEVSVTFRMSSDELAHLRYLLARVGVEVTSDEQAIKELLYQDIDCQHVDYRPGVTKVEIRKV